MKILVLIDEENIKDIEHEVIDREFFLKDKLCGSGQCEELNDYDKRKVIEEARKAIELECGIEIQTYLSRSEVTGFQITELKEVLFTNQPPQDFSYEELLEIFKEYEG